MISSEINGEPSIMDGWMAGVICIVTWQKRLKRQNYIILLKNLTNENLNQNHQLHSHRSQDS